MAHTLAGLCDRFGASGMAFVRSRPHQGQFFPTFFFPTTQGLESMPEVFSHLLHGGGMLEWVPEAIFFRFGFF